MLKKKSLKQIDLKGKKALVRVDFNVPLDSSGQITDDTRIRATLPTINHILDSGGSVIIMSHLGRPRGNPVPSMSLLRVSKRLARLLKLEVKFAPDCIGQEVRKAADELQPGEVLYACVRWCWFAGPAQEATFCAAARDSSQDPSAA